MTDTPPPPAPTLQVHIDVPGAAPPVGTPIAAKGGLSAAVALEVGAVALGIRLSDRPAAEVRWLVDQVVRKVEGTFSLADEVRLSVGDAVEDALADTLTLDLANRFGDRLVHERADGLDATAASEALYRRWVDEDPTIRTSRAIAADALAWSRRHAGELPVEVQVFDRDACEALGLRLLMAVGGASEISPPTLVIARYTPPEATLAPWMLLGKGITFDTGGVNVKPYDAFVSMMKNDMGGAALTWALFTHLAEAGHPRPLIAVIPTCENPVGEGAMRPGSVVESYSGLKVRIDHTDAEGRLILADALAFATKRHPVERVISAATLTTAALIAYGPYATPVHFAPPSFEAALTRASAATGEDLHFFPRRVWHFEANRDDEADVKNTARLPGNARRGAGSRNAAHFLLHFTDRPLTHLDIFASTWNWAGDAPGSGPGATGAPLRTLIEALTAHDA